MKETRVAILGATGSIGCQALEVIAETPGLCACGLAAGGNWQLLAEQTANAEPEVVALADGASHDDLKARLADHVVVLTGPDAMAEMVRRCRPDVLLTAVVGAAGLEPTLAGIECGATLAIANKETLVMAGAVVMPAARAAGVDVLPVDSEHSAIFQCLSAGRREEVRRVVITASGGALRDWPEDRLANATVEEALNHPTWSMGRKITVDSATLINKALEIIEAHWLFGLEAEEIGVVLHAESIVHSYVEYCDGSVIAQMGRPDMTGPIAYALSWPGRRRRDVAPLDLAELGSLTFRAVDGRFARAVELGFEAIRKGGVAPAVLNSANEAAVAAFLDGRIGFGRIVPLVEDALAAAPAGGGVDLAALREADAWACARVNDWIEQRASMP